MRPFLVASIGVGCWLYKCCDIDFGIVPTIEGHLFTPLNHTVRSSDIYVPDYFVITAGTYLLCGRSTLGLALGTPMTGPKPFDVEGIVSLNVQF